MRPSYEIEVAEQARIPRKSRIRRPHAACTIFSCAHVIGWRVLRQCRKDSFEVVRKSLPAILPASHRAHCADHLGVKRGETIRNMGVKSDTRITPITRVYLGRALRAR